MKLVSHKNEHPNNDKIAKALSQVLADTFALYVKALNFHWNVKGPMFIGLHAFFESQYTELAEAIDEIAERIQQMDCYTPASLAAYKKMTHVDETQDQLEASKMIESLVQGHEVLIKTCQKATEVAEGDEVTLDLLIQRQKFHDKSIWMLKSLQAK